MRVACLSWTSLSQRLADRGAVLRARPREMSPTVGTQESPRGT